MPSPAPSHCYTMVIYNHACNACSQLVFSLIRKLSVMSCCNIAICEGTDGNRTRGGVGLPSPLIFPCYPYRLLNAVSVPKMMKCMFQFPLSVGYLGPVGKYFPENLEV